MHSSMQVWHMAMHASSIAIMEAGVIPCMRIIERIMVLHMSAQFIHAGAHDIIWVEQTVHACSQAEQASIQACRTAMSISCMPGIDIMSFDMAPIIMLSIAHLLPLSGRRAGRPACGHARPRGFRIEGPIRLDRVTSQGIHTARPSRAAALATAVLLALAAGVVTASPASAHDELLGSDPAADSTVEVLPAELTLTFSGVIAPDEGASEVQVTDAEGTTLTDGTPSAQDNVLTQPLAAEGLGGEASGLITVLWKVVSSDGHPISGEFSFTVTGAPGPDPTQTTEPAPAPSESIAPSESPTGETTPSAAPAADEVSSALPWIILGLIAAAVVGGVTYLLVSRSRRERALAEGARDGAQPGSEPPADR